MLLEHMHKKVEINRPKIKGGCQLGSKVSTHNSKSDLPLVGFILLHYFSSVFCQDINLSSTWNRSNYLMQQSPFFHYSLDISTLYNSVIYFNSSCWFYDEKCPFYPEICMKSISPTEDCNNCTKCSVFTFVEFLMDIDDRKSPLSELLWDEGAAVFM